MKKIFCYFLLLAGLHTWAQQVQSPRQTYPGLFEKVQLARIYPDGKSFPDAVPKFAPAAIMKDYLSRKDLKGFDLKQFVLDHFTLPESHGNLYQSNINAGIEKHLDTLWQVLKRSPDTASILQTSLLPLPKPYIVPGGRFREVYYWDSYFTMLGLQQAGKTEVIKDMVDNFAFLIRKYGFIPNGNRSYYLTRSQPPFFALMVQLLASTDPKVKLSDYKKELELEYDFWMKGASQIEKGKAINHVVKLKDGTILNRYFDAGNQPREESYREDFEAARKTTQNSALFYRNVRSAAESGWDFSSRWFADGENFSQIITTDLLPVDLNALLYNLETTIARASVEAGDSKKANLFLAKAAKRKMAISKYFWNNNLKFFTDYNWKTQGFSKQETLAALFPLYFKLASPVQAKNVYEKVKHDFLKPGGLVTTLKSTGQQWDAPNAWAPLQWISIQGLHHYGYDELANDISQRWIKLNVDVFKKSGKLIEKYDVVNTDKTGGGGEYPLQDGFGWTNGVLLKLLKSN